MRNVGGTLLTGNTQTFPQVSVARLRPGLLFESDLPAEQVERGAES